MRAHAIRLTLPIIVLCAPLTARAEPPKTCSLLTTADLTAALGVAVGEGKEMNTVVPSGAYKGEAVSTCMWPMGTKGGFNVSITRAPKSDAEREQFKELMHKTSAKLEAKGWSVERKAIGVAKCFVMIAPASEEGMHRATGCFAEGKGKGISAGYLATHGVEAGPEKVKQLLDQAVARLP